MRTRWKGCAAAAMLTAAAMAGFWVWAQPADQLGARVVSRGFPRDKEIAITFDDGPHPVTTALLLDILKRSNVKATFFVVGRMAEQYPELLRRIRASGHQIACHTYSHSNLAGKTEQQTMKELAMWEEAVDKVVGRGSRYLRPPGGNYSRETISVVRKRGYVLTLWSVNPGDWSRAAPARLIQCVQGKAHPGAVVLMHDDGMNTVQALPTILKRLRADGYRFVTVDELAGRAGAPPGAL